MTGAGVLSRSGLTPEAIMITPREGKNAGPKSSSMERVAVRKSPPWICD